MYHSYYTTTDSCQNRTNLQYVISSFLDVCNDSRDKLVSCNATTITWDRYSDRRCTEYSATESDEYANCDEGTRDYIGACSITSTTSSRGWGDKKINALLAGLGAALWVIAAVAVFINKRLQSSKEKEKAPKNEEEEEEEGCANKKKIVEMSS